MNPTKRLFQQIILRLRKIAVLKTVSPIHTTEISPCKIGSRCGLLEPLGNSLQMPREVSRGNLRKASVNYQKQNGLKMVKMAYKLLKINC